MMKLGCFAVLRDKDNPGQFMAATGDDVLRIRN